VFTHTIRVEQETPLYETANIVYRRECFEDAGGFMVDWNPHAITPLGGEDVDLAWRAKRKGWKTKFAPTALVHHAVLPMKGVAWVRIERLQVFPWLIRQYPELRAFFFARYFYDRAQAFIFGALAGVALAPVSLWFLLAVVPYVWLRASEPTKTLRGPLRLLRPGFYALRDVCSLGILFASSVKARSLLL
jgi:cellulose synthase/poly-beta-1,6-N-acetylglucosamine synthase-like glycosyltransferase